MLEIAYTLVAVALIVFLIYMTITVKTLGDKAGKMLDETENTIKVLTSDVNVTLHQTNDLIAKVKPVCRLIHKDDLCTLHQRARDIGKLPLTTAHARIRLVF